MGYKATGFKERVNTDGSNSYTGVMEGIQEQHRHGNKARVGLYSSSSRTPRLFHLQAQGYGNM
jgi:hypothetical protein